MPNSSGDIQSHSELVVGRLSALPPDFLAKKNIHPRDEFITFDEGPHIYTVHGELGYTSVTTFVHKHFPSFDSDRIIANILKSPRHKTDPTYKYYNQTKEEIELAWEINRNQASSAGTKMHYDIECYFNELPVENDSTEFKYFQNFCKDFVDCPNSSGDRVAYLRAPKVLKGCDPHLGVTGRVSSEGGFVAKRLEPQSGSVRFLHSFPRIGKADSEETDQPPLPKGVSGRVSSEETNVPSSPLPRLYSHNR